MIILIVIGLVAVAGLLPLGAIWALNTLFALTVPFTLKTWAAALLLIAIVTGSSHSS